MAGEDIRVAVLGMTDNNDLVEVLKLVDEDVCVAILGLANEDIWRIRILGWQF